MVGLNVSEVSMLLFLDNQQKMSFGLMWSLIAHLQVHPTFLRNNTIKVENTNQISRGVDIQIMINGRTASIFL